MKSNKQILKEKYPELPENNDKLSYEQVLELMDTVKEEAKKQIPSVDEVKKIADDIPVFPPLKIALEHKNKWIQGGINIRKLIYDKLNNDSDEM